jgi:hypothetical protein
MTRGRKKDLTIPPSRALAQQRDYRARKAEYVYSLSYEQDLNIPENNAVRFENWKIDVKPLKTRR